MNNTLTILCGLPRSGKSTWVEKNKGNSIVVSNDWIRENILGTQYSHSANAIIWAIVDASLRIILSQDKDVILDGINNTPDIRKFFIDIGREYGAKIKMVCFMTPLEVCLARNDGMFFDRKIPNEELISISNKRLFPIENEYDEIIYVGGCSMEKGGINEK